MFVGSEKAGRGIDGSENDSKSVKPSMVDVASTVGEGRTWVVVERAAGPDWKVHT